MRSTTRKRRRRFVRPLAIAGSAIALAAPASAAAMQRDSTLPPSSASDQVGAKLDHRGLNEKHSQTFVTTVRIHPAGNDDSRTVAIALASSALGIALCGSGYAAFGVARMRRRLRATQ